MTLEAQTIARACGKKPTESGTKDLCALTVEASAITGVPLTGTDWIRVETNYFLNSKNYASKSLTY